MKSKIVGFVRNKRDDPFCRAFVCDSRVGEDNGDGE